jgi:hypothetical protein
MSVEVLVLRQGSGVLCQAGGQHAGHDCRPQHVVQSLQALRGQPAVHVEEEIVDILQSKLKILQPQFER